jgi:hypothetical protein
MRIKTTKETMMKSFINYLTLVLLILSLPACRKRFMEALPASDEIPLSEIDKVVTAQMRDIAKSYIVINGHKYQPLEGDVDEGKLLLHFSKGRAVLGFLEPDLKPDGTLKIDFRQPGRDGSQDVLAFTGAGLKVSEKYGGICISGEITNPLNQEAGRVEIYFNDSVIGSGTTRLTLERNRAILTGVLGTRSYVEIKELIQNHPEITTLVLQDVPGSMNDPVNMHTGRIIRKAGYKIVVPANSVIASGGVDLFCSGKERIAEPGSKLGVHSWWDNGMSADDLSEDDPAHDAQIHYFTEMLGEKGRAFYFYTLRAAHSDSIHWMTGNEIKQWGLVTE